MSLLRLRFYDVYSNVYYYFLLSKFNQWTFHSHIQIQCWYLRALNCSNDKDFINICTNHMYFGKLRLFNLLLIYKEIIWNHFLVFETSLCIHFIQPTNGDVKFPRNLQEFLRQKLFQRVVGCQKRKYFFGNLFLL